MRTQDIGRAGEVWVADRLRSLGYAVAQFGANYPVVDLNVTARTPFRVQVKCSDVQHIKFGSARALDGLLPSDFVIALMPSGESTLETSKLQSFVIPALVAQSVAHHVHDSYVQDYIARKGHSPSGAFGPTIKFYRNKSWHIEARETLEPYKEAWSKLPAPV